MRQVLSISLQKEKIKKIKTKAKKSGFESISQYFNYLFDMDNENSISEKELESYIKKARQEYKRGKAIKANSIAELL
jgi:hypothetical protein